MKIVRSGRTLKVEEAEQPVIPTVVRRKPRADIVISELKIIGSATIIQPLIKISGNLAGALASLKSAPGFRPERKYMAWSSVDGFFKFSDDMFHPTEWKRLKG